MESENVMYKVFSLAFYKKAPENTEANKWKLEVETPTDAWNLKKQKWTKPASQRGYKALTKREIFSDIKDETNARAGNFNSCNKFVGRYEELLETATLAIEGNDVTTKFKIAKAGGPRPKESSWSGKYTFRVFYWC